VDRRSSANTLLNDSDKAMSQDDLKRGEQFIGPLQRCKTLLMGLRGIPE
jgi:hypothetical protein